MAAFTTSLLIASIIASTTTSAISSIKSGNAAKRAGKKEQEAAESEAQLEDFNANVADVQAKDAIERGADEESRFRESVRTLIGSQRTGFAKSGVDVSFGSALDVQADAAFLGEQDALQIRTNAGREAWGYQVEATNRRRQADITRRTGEYRAAAGVEAQTASRYAAAGTIAGGSASLLQARYGFDRRGVNGGR